MGSKFWFTATLGMPPRAVEWTGRRIDPRGMRVLVVDPSPVHREVVCSQLASWGLSSAAAAGGREALGLVEGAVQSKDPFGVVIMNGGLHDMSAEALAREIRRRASCDQSAALMILTAMGGRVDAGELAARGFDGHIGQPVRQSQLFDAIMSGMARAEASPAQPAAAEAQVAEKAGGKSGVRILLVEDNEVNQMVAAELLAEAGYTCDCAADGRKAVEAVARKSYDLVLMDCQMPEMDGFEATRAIRAREARGPLPGRVGRLPIIALTANALKGDRERCIEAGMDEYLSKPLHPDHLLQTIGSYLAGCRAEVETGGVRG
jgi:CheY-like chemotaxis protein